MLGQNITVARNHKELLWTRQIGNFSRTQYNVYKQLEGTGNTIFPERDEDILSVAFKHKGKAQIGGGG
jgi:hypothetical protein